MFRSGTCEWGRTSPFVREKESEPESPGTYFLLRWRTFALQNWPGADINMVEVRGGGSQAVSILAVISSNACSCRRLNSSEWWSLNQNIFKNEPRLINLTLYFTLTHWLSQVFWLENISLYVKITNGTSPTPLTVCQHSPHVWRWFNTTDGTINHPHEASS